MADTERTIATLLSTNFVNGQAAGSITPQDMRDLIISLRHQYGDCYVSTAVETTIASQNTWAKALGTTTVGSSLLNVSMPANNRLRNDGDQTRIFLCTATMEIICAGSAKQLGFGVGVNGTVNANSEVGYMHVTAASETHVMVQALLSVAASSYVEVFVRNVTDAVNLTIQKMNFTIQGLAT
jgi:hypothetical protein